MKIQVKKPTREELDSLGVISWPIWEKEASTFPWVYDMTETCYLLQGRVTVTTGDGASVTFGEGDLVVFPEGLSCTWTIHSPVRKRYSFN